MQTECIFCKIVAGEVPARIVVEDDRAVAFRDINPQAPVHVVVVPRQHVEWPGGPGPGDAPLLGLLLLVAREVAQREGLMDRGFRLVINAGPDSGQSVLHIHVHVLGGRPMGWPPG